MKPGYSASIILYELHIIINYIASVWGLYEVGKYKLATWNCICLEQYLIGSGFCWKSILTNIYFVRHLLCQKHNIWSVMYFS